jgi:hypothetical protein
VSELLILCHSLSSIHKRSLVVSSDYEPPSEEIMVDASSIHFVRVRTDDRTQQLWAAAAARNEAVDRVLDAAPRHH